MHELQVETVPVDALVLDPGNVRTHSQRNIDAITDSLRLFGQRRPIVVWHDTVIAGNGTLTAARGLGWQHIAVVRCPDDWTHDLARAYAVADNRSAELAEWDGAELLATLNTLTDDLLQASGFTSDDLADLERIWGQAPDLDLLAGDLGDHGDHDEDSLVPLSFRVPKTIADKWHAAVKATGKADPVEGACEVVLAAHSVLCDE